MHWQDICAHPALQDLPFKVETDRWGHIVMSPATNRHARLQSLILRLLDREMSDGEAFVDCAIATTEGIKGADVAWASLVLLCAFARDSLTTRYPGHRPVPFPLASRYSLVFR